MGVVSRHGGSCDFAQDDTRVFMAHAVATPSAQVGRFAPGGSLVVILRAVAGSTRANAIARSAA